MKTEALVKPSRVGFVFFSPKDSVSIFHFARSSTAVFNRVLANIIKDVKDQIHLGWEHWSEDLRMLIYSIRLHQIVPKWDSYSVSTLRHC